MGVDIQAIKKGTVLRCNNLDGWFGDWVVLSSNVACGESQTVVLAPMRVRENIGIGAFSIVSVWFNKHPYFVVLDLMMHQYKSTLISSGAWEYVGDMFYPSMYQVDKTIWTMFGLAGDIGLFETHHRNRAEESLQKEEYKVPEIPQVKYDGTEQIDIDSEDIGKKPVKTKIKDEDTYKNRRLKLTARGKTICESHGGVHVTVVSEELRRDKYDKAYRFSDIKCRIHIDDVKEVKEDTNDGKRFSLEDRLDLVLDLLTLDKDTIERKYKYIGTESIASALWNSIKILNENGIVWKVWVVRFLNYKKKYCEKHNKNKECLYSDNLIKEVEAVLNVSYDGKKRLHASKELTHRL